MTAPTSPLTTSTPTASRPLAAIALIAGALGLPTSLAHAEASLVTGQGGASASLNFRIIIPPVMRVLENSHPMQLQPTADGSALTAEQRLVVVSNMKRGFCVALRQTDPALNSWQLQTDAQTGGTTLTPTAEGYRLCTTRPGRYTLRLQHAFVTDASSDRSSLNPNAPSNTTSLSASGALHNTRLNWPIQTELTAL